MKKLFVLSIFLVMIIGFADAPILPSQLTCTVTWTSNGSYTLNPTLMVLEDSSPSWANGTTLQEARCDVNCSLYAAPPPPPSANQIWAVLVPVLVSLLVMVVFVVLVPVMVLV